MGITNRLLPNMVCSIPRVSNFLVCMDLKTGTIILGIVNLVSAVTLAFYSLIALAVGVGVTVASQTSTTFKEKAGEDATKGFMAVGIVGIIVLVVLLLIAVLYLGIASALIHGARTGRPGLLMPWIVLTAVTLFLDVINILWSLISLVIQPLILGILFLGVWVIQNGATRRRAKMKQERESLPVGDRGLRSL